MEPKVFIILLNYNGYKDTIECVQSVEKINYKNYKIIIADNKSTDDSLKKIEKYLKENNKSHILLTSKENKGFAAGNNIGIKYALENNCDYVLLLNNDTLVHEDFLGELIKSIESKDRNEKLGMATGKIYYEEKRDTFWFAGGEFNFNRFYGSHIGQGERDIGQYDVEKEISFCTGCLMLISREVLERVGPLKEEYFMYYEDVDYCLKLRHNNYKILYVPKAKIYHKVSSSTGGEASPFAIEWNTRNRKRIIKNFKSYIDASKYIKVISFFYVTRIIVLVKYLLKGRFDLAKAMLIGQFKINN